MSTNPSNTPAQKPGGDHPLFNLPPNVNNFFLECARVATEGGDIHPFFRNARAAKKAAKTEEADHGAV